MGIRKIKNNKVVSRAGLKIFFITIIMGLLVVIKSLLREGSCTTATQEVFLAIAERFFQPTKQEFASRTISLEPYMLEKTIYGKSYSFYITANSLIDIPQQIQVYPARLGQELDGTHLFITEPWWGTELINVSPSEFTLEPKKSMRIKVDFKVPEEKITGGFYSAIVFESTPINKKDESVKTGVILAFTLPGELKREGVITDVSLLQDKPDESIAILLTFTNLGNIHLRIYGDVIIRNHLGLEIANLPLRPPQVTLPNSSCQLNANWKPKNLPVGTYTAQTNVNITDANPVKRLTQFVVIRPNEIGIIKLEIASFTIPIAVWSSPIYFNLLAFNAGNMNLTTTGEITIKNREGEIIATAPLSKVTIPPKGTKQLQAVLTQALSIGSYTACTRVEYDGKIKVATQDFMVSEKELTQEGKLLEFTIPVTPAGKPIIPKLIFKNTGESSIYVEGMIEIMDSQRNVIGEIPIARVELEPDTIQNLGKSAELKLLPGKYQAIVTLIIGGKEIITQETSIVIGN